MYDLDCTFESSLGFERVRIMRARFSSFVQGYLDFGPRVDMRLFLASCLRYAMFDMGCELPMSLVVRRYFDGSSTCKCVDFGVVEPLHAVLFGLRAAESHPAQIVDVGFDTGQDAFWIHLNGNCHDVS